MSNTIEIHSVTIANANDGSVHGHATGCADLHRGREYRDRRDEQWQMEVTSKRNAFLEYNSDFIAEGGEDNAWEIHWLPCADHVPADGTDAAAPVEAAAPKPKKADLVAALVEFGLHRPALNKMTLAALEALLVETQAATPDGPAAAETEAPTDAPSDSAAAPTKDTSRRRGGKASEGSEAGEEMAAPPAPRRRTKNVLVEVDGAVVKTGAWMTMHREGQRIAIIRREAVPVLNTAVTEKVLRVQTAYQIDEQSIGWIRNGESLASVARVLKKAIKAADEQTKAASK